MSSIAGDLGLGAILASALHPSVLANIAAPAFLALALLPSVLANAAAPAILAFAFHPSVLANAAAPAFLALALLLLMPANAAAPALLALVPLPSMLANAGAPAILTEPFLFSMLANAAAPAVLASASSPPMLANAAAVFQQRDKHVNIIIVADCGVLLMVAHTTLRVVTCTTPTAATVILFAAHTNFLDATCATTTAATATGRCFGRHNPPHDFLVKRERPRPIVKPVRLDAVARALGEAAARPCYVHFDGGAVVRFQDAGVQRSGCNVRVVAVYNIAVYVPMHPAEQLHLQATAQARAVLQHAHARHHAAVRRSRGGAKT